MYDSKHTTALTEQQKKHKADRRWVQHMTLLRYARLDREDASAGRSNKFRCAKYLRIPPYWRSA